MVVDGQIYPSGLNCIINAYGLHRNPKYFENPDDFIPTRFAEIKSELPFAFIPFSAGQRNCIGQKFAMLEAKYVISAVIRNFELSPPTSDEKLVLVAETILKGLNGIKISSRDFGIPSRTLRRHLASGAEKGPSGRASDLGFEHEKRILQHIKALEKEFLPQIVVTLYQWLINLHKKDNELIDKPGKNFNIEETSIQVNNKPGEVLATKDAKEVYTLIRSEKGKNVSVIARCSEEGYFMPPLLSLKIIMFAVLVYSLLVVTLVTFFLWWRKRPSVRVGNFPSPPSVFLLGHGPYINSTKKLLPYFHKHLLENNGIIKLLVGPKVLLVVSNHEFLKWITSTSKFTHKPQEYQYLKDWLGDGLLIAKGDRWKTHRRILNQAFNYQALENHIQVVENTSNILVRKLEDHIGQDSLDIYPIISSFTFDVVCESSMATSVNALENDNSEYLHAVRELSRIIIDRALNPLKMFDFIFKFHPDYKISKDSIKIIHDFDLDVIRKRSQKLKEELNNQDESDNINMKRNKKPLLDTLLTARYENGNPIADTHIREEVDTFIFAGYDTTASALGFVLYNIANHPAVQEQIIEEQKMIFHESFYRPSTYSDVNEMKYLEMVVKETFRLFPPIPLIGRKIHEDTYYNGELLPAGIGILLNFYSLHRNPELYPDPEKFDPLRFEDDKNIPLYSYLPFSAGSRNCIGRKFAMNQVKQTVSKIVRHFKLLPATPSHTLELVSESILKSKTGFCIKLEKRQL
ncbi:hypothetical protein HHI36_006480 [Cryptolaemus montrouzieri]|uniref:Cytochrome P450 n=1 Tax=Cryptolaemus montrouzieri TaxID=559131 RepID=A0ABD2NY94_9CUCU